MKKKIFFLFILSFFVLSVFADDIVISRTQLADFLEQTKNYSGYTPDDLYRYYEQNALKFENDFKHTIISRKSGQKIPKIANLQYYKSKANYGTKKKGISR